VHTAVTMSDFSFWTAALVLMAFAIWHGLGWGLVGLMVRSRVSSSLAVVIVPAAVVAQEFAWPQLFPWHMGNTFFRVPLLMQGMDLLGIWGATFVAVTVSVALAQAALGSCKWRRSALVATVLVIGWVAYGAIRLGTWEPAGADDEVTLALVQPDITPSDKKKRGVANRKALFARLRDMTLQADLTGVDAVIWPEGAFPFYFALETGGRTNWDDVVAMSKELQAMPRTLQRTAIVGTLTKPVDRTRNSVLMLGPDGQEMNRYDKRRLLAFGEYMPLSDTLPFLKNSVKEVSDMEAGDSVSSLRLGPALILPTLCYEAIFPEFVRTSLNEVGGNVIVNLTNDSWFGESGAPAQHLMDQVPRAVELRVPLVRVTATGINAVVLPTGEFALETGLHERRVDVVRVPAQDTFSLYREIGPVLPVACLVLLIWVIGTAWWKRHCPPVPPTL